MRLVIAAGVYTLVTGAMFQARPMAQARAQTPAAPGAVRACSLLTKAEVKNIIGAGNRFWDQLPVTEEPLRSGGSSCTYANAVVQINPFAFSVLEDMRKKAPAEYQTVPDVGDLAYIHVNRGEYAELYARARQHVVTVQLDMDGPFQTLDGARPAAAALANALIAKLPK